MGKKKTKAKAAEPASAPPMSHTHQPMTVPVQPPVQEAASITREHYQAELVQPDPNIAFEFIPERIEAGRLAR